MRQSQTIDFKEIGPVYFERSFRAKRLNISIRAPGKVRVGVPQTVTLDQAKIFVRCHIEWIQKHLNRLHKEAALPRPSNILNTLEKLAAEEKITKRVNELAKRYGFVFNRLTIRNQKTKWGSCSSKNNLSLNMKLARLPHELLDYVIVHELVHTRIKNHSREFWSELKKYMPDARLKDSELNKYNLRLL